MPEASANSIALIACRVLESEIAEQLRQSKHVVRQEFFEIGLHDQPAVLRARLRAAIDRAESDAAVDTVVLVYGLCGLALVSLTPRLKPIVVPRAHDCITLFLGSKERYASCMGCNPGTYWYSPGWNRDRRVPGPDRELKLRVTLCQRFDSEEVEALIEMDRESFRHFGTAAYTDHGLPGDEPQREYAERCAHSLGWKFQYHRGDPKLLRDLLHGPWDEARFLTLWPGQRIMHTADGNIVAAEPGR